MTSLLIGCGNLGKIILEGFYKKNKRIAVLDNDLKVRDQINDNYKRIKIFRSMREVEWKDIEYVMICVKPNISIKILKEIKNFCNNNHVIISFVAGLKTDSIQKYINPKSIVVRIMPNIFIESRNSATALFSKKADDKLRNKISKDFGHFGILIWMKKENKLDFFTAMFGGGPAYLFFILECFHRLNRKNGISSDNSILLITSLIEGALRKIKGDNINFHEFIKKVASKGGTTEEALKVFANKQSFYRLFKEGVENAKKKSSLISKNLV